MFVCEKCEGVGYHKPGCPDYPLTTAPPACGHDFNALVDVDEEGHAVCSECEPSLSDRPAPVVPDSPGLRQAVYRALDDTRGWHPSAADQRLSVLDRLTDAVLAVVADPEVLAGIAEVLRDAEDEWVRRYADAEGAPPTRSELQAAAVVEWLRGQA